MLTQDRWNPGQNTLRALRVARRSWWQRAMLDASLAAALCAAAAVVVAWLRAWALGETGNALGSAGAARAVAAAAAGGFAVWLATVGLRRPSLLELARRVDSLLSQKERFSTTFEVLAKGGPSNVVSWSLLEEVEERANGLDASRAGWARRSRGLGRAAAVATGIAALAIAVPVPVRTAPRQAGGVATAAPAAAETAPDPATLGGVAELLDLVAEQEDSDYLRALAASFAELAERVSTNATSAAEANLAARELADHLRTAAHEVGGAFEAAVEAAFAPVPEQAPAVGQAGPQASPQQQAGGGAAEEAAAAAPSSTQDPSASYYMSLSALMDQFEEDPSAVGVRRPLTNQAAGGGEAFYGGVLNAETDPNAAPPQQPALARGQGEAGGAPAGAAERSREGAGDAAGQGAADPGAGSDSYLDLPAAGGELAALQPNEREGGRFVEMELVPQAKEGDSSAAATTGPPPAFARSEEAAFAFRGIGAAHADAVSRYFTPGSVPGQAGQ